MVLQQKTKAPFWGWGEPGEKLEIEASWGARASAAAGPDGRWMTKLQTPAAGGPYEIKVKGTAQDELTLREVLIGEVWFCSGQSNMELPMSATSYAPAETDSQLIRLFQVGRSNAQAPAADVSGSWAYCDPSDAAHFSAAAFYFGKRLQETLRIPIGLIESSWGGTDIELWTSQEGLSAGIKPGEKTQVQQGFYANGLYNGMVAPVIPYAIRGVLWYQGENNVWHLPSYGELLPGMIRDWRIRWREGDFPFYIVQIAPFRYNSGLRSAEVRQAELETSRGRNCGLVVTTDIAGDVGDIHPKDKLDVGERLARWALHDVYGDRKIARSGPLYKRMRTEGDKIRILFDHCQGGLVARGGALNYFLVAGPDHVFYPAKAEIDRDSVVVSSPEVPAPVAVRFAYEDAPVPNLFNGAGLPASPFRTDDWSPS